MRRWGLAFSMVVVGLVGCGDGGSVPPVDGGDGSTLDAPVGDGGCVAPEQLCGSRCVDTQKDPNNCGSCGNACSGGAFCQEGECERTCTDGFMSCGGSCVDVSDDPDHCGECDNACDEGRTCMGGSCVCEEGFIECGGVCVDPDTHLDHCGMCDRSCSSAESCRDGSCVPQTETDCLDEMDNDEDGMTDCEDVEDCEGTARECDCPDTADTGTEICGSSGTWGDCMGCEPPPECTFDTDCDYGYECSGGSCRFDDTSRWDIVVVDAEINSRTLDDGCWDSCAGFCCGDPDPFAQVQVESSSSADTGSTSTVDDTLFPEWNEKILINMEAWKIRDYLAFELRDSDPAGSNRIGRCFFRGLSDFYFGGDIRTMNCPRDPEFDNAGFRLRFRIQEP